MSRMRCPAMGEVFKTCASITSASASPIEYTSRTRPWRIWRKIELTVVARGLICASMPKVPIIGTIVGSLIRAIAILQPMDLARTAASMFVLSSSVIAKTASARPIPASINSVLSKPSPFSTIVRSNASAASSATERLRSITLMRIRRSSCSRAWATRCPTFPPPTMTMRSCFAVGLPKISVVRRRS